MLSRDIKKLITKKPTFASLLDEATKPYGNSRKHRAAINKEEAPAAAASEPSKGLPFGKSRKHKQAITKAAPAEAEAPVEEIPEEEYEDDPLATATDMEEAPDADAGAEEEAPEDPAAEAELEAEAGAEDEAAAAEEEAADAIADEVEEQEVKQDEHDHARVMSIDVRKINKTLAVLCAKQVDSFPINSIREILALYNLKMVDEDGNDLQVALIGADGNTDIELAYTNGQRISNSALILYWHRIDNQLMYDVNAYLS
jgi:hypothetical protein